MNLSQITPNPNESRKICEPAERPLTPDEVWGLVPTAGEIDWGAPQPRVPTPEAWTDPDSIAVELADRKCARLIANALHDPPITEKEIEKHARQFKISAREAEIEIREGRREL